MIKLMGIHKQFGNDKVLEEVNLTLENNGIYIIKGKSGCGKTTLLNIIGLIDEDYEGKYYVYQGKVNTIEDNYCELDDYVVEEGGVDEDGYTIPDTYVFDSSILPELVQEQYDLSKDGWEIENVEAYEFD